MYTAPEMESAIRHNGIYVCVCGHRMGCMQCVFWAQQAGIWPNACLGPLAKCVIFDQCRLMGMVEIKTITRGC